MYKTLLLPCKQKIHKIFLPTKLVPVISELSSIYNEQDFINGSLISNFLQIGPSVLITIIVALLRLSVADECAAPSVFKTSIEWLLIFILP